LTSRGIVAGRLIVDSDVIFTPAGPIASFTLNRPQAGNAMTWPMYDALVEACDRVDADRGVRVFVIRANGGVFCTGTDIAQFTSFTSGGDGLEYERRLEAAVSRLERVGVPTIAQVEGAAAGAGFAIALACDLRVCSPGARFGVPIARTLGNALSIENCARLIAHLGVTVTKDLLFTGRFCDAREAERIGFVTRVVDALQVPDVVVELAMSIASNAPLTIRAVKAALRQAHAHGARDSREVQDLIAACYASDDFRQAVTAFLEKRKPSFGGR
jgi:enoyl-CoA hydratase/carnithine racemase